MGFRRTNADRSLMFTALLNVDPAFPRMESRDGEKRTSKALEAWYRSDYTDMYAFAQRWAKEN